MTLYRSAVQMPAYTVFGTAFAPELSETGIARGFGFSS